VKVVFNTIIDCVSGFQMPERENGLGATNITFANNFIRGGSPVSIRGSYPDAVWKENILWNITGGDMPASGYIISEFSEHQAATLKTPEGQIYPSIPETNRPLVISDVGPDAVQYQNG
jgi:hypothetical protein